MSRARWRTSADLAVPGGPTSSMCSPPASATSIRRTSSSLPRNRCSNARPTSRSLVPTRTSSPSRTGAARRVAGSWALMGPNTIPRRARPSLARPRPGSPRLPAVEVARLDVDVAGGVVRGRRGHVAAAADVVGVGAGAGVEPDRAAVAAGVDVAVAVAGADEGHARVAGDVRADAEADVEGAVREAGVVPPALHAGARAGLVRAGVEPGGGRVRAVAKDGLGLPGDEDRWVARGRRPVGVGRGLALLDDLLPLRLGHLHLGDHRLAVGPLGDAGDLEGLLDGRCWGAGGRRGAGGLLVDGL